MADAYKFKLKSSKTIMFPNLKKQMSRILAIDFRWRVALFLLLKM